MVFVTLGVIISRYLGQMHELIERVENVFFKLKDSPILVLSSVAFFLGAVGLIVGCFLLSKSWPTATWAPSPPPSKEIEESPPEATQVASVSAQVVVDVSGAVKKPGIYSLASTSRIFNALEAAGGFSKDADLGFIYKEINLADKLAEGQKLYFPPIQTETDNLSSSNTEITGQDSLISINSASAEELDLLPGIGEKLASKIIEGRPYKTIQELTTKIKIGDSVFGKIQNLIRL
ncbi:hypothetical protein BH09PAT1_BH09PAT1_7500 [soil metagenome]